MAFRYEEHTADVTIVATGSTLEAAFADAARAVTHVMTDEEVADEFSYSVSLVAESREALLFDFLAHVIFLLDTEGLFVARASLNITRTGTKFVLSGALYGDEARHYKRSGDVKAPTYNRLEVSEDEGGWLVRCTLDL